MSEKSNGRKLTVEELTSQVRSMVQEELRAAREASKPAKKLVKEAVNPDELDAEDLNPIFARMRPETRKALTKWIMRYFFSPKKKDQPWWSPKINDKNVLAYISHLRSGFPLSPVEVVDDWKINQSLRKDMAKIADADIDAFEKNQGPVSPQANSEKTLDAIAKDMGGVSIPTVRTLEISGLEKLKKILGGRNFLEMDEEELDAMLSNVKTAREQTSVTFAKAIKDAGGDVNKFLRGLVAKNIITPIDVKMLLPREIEMITFLMDKPEDQIAEYLRGDALKADNKMKTFQAAVARALSPVRPRGRPRKNPV